MTHQLQNKQEQEQLKQLVSHNIRGESARADSVFRSYKTSVGKSKAIELPFSSRSRGPCSLEHRVSVNLMARSKAVQGYIFAIKPYSFGDARAKFRYAVPRHLLCRSELFAILQSCHQDAGTTRGRQTMTIPTS